MTYLDPAVVLTGRTRPMPMPAIEAPADDVPMPDVPLLGMADVQGAAHSLAAARAAAEEAAGPLQAAEAYHQRIVDRIAMLTGERDGIVARRTAGDCQDDDGPRLELIRCDLEGLERLRGDAEASLVEPRRVAQAARNAVAAAQHAFSTAQAETEETALIAHADRLADLLLATIDQVDAAARRLGRGRSQWKPSSALAAAVRKAAIAHKVA